MKSLTFAAAILVSLFTAAFSFGFVYEKLPFWVTDENRWIVCWATYLHVNSMAAVGYVLVRAKLRKNR